MKEKYERKFCTENVNINLKNFEKIKKKINRDK